MSEKAGSMILVEQLRKIAEQFEYLANADEKLVNPVLVPSLRKFTAETRALLRHATGKVLVKPDIVMGGSYAPAAVQFEAAGAIGNTIEEAFADLQRKLDIRAE